MSQINLFNSISTEIIWPEDYIQGEIFDSPITGLDIETEGLIYLDSNKKIISFATSHYKNIASCVWAYDNLNIKQEQQLTNLLTNPYNIIVGHNLKFDLNWIRYKLGIDIKCQIFDTQFACYLLNENRTFSLEYLVDTFLGDQEIFKNYKQQMDRTNLLNHSRDEILIYNGKDADASRQLFDILTPKLSQKGLLALAQTGNELIKCVSKMETRGVYVDQEWKKHHEDKLFNKLISTRLELQKIVGGKFNPNKEDELHKVIFDQMGFSPTLYTNVGNDSMSFEALSQMYKQFPKDERKNKFLDTLIDYRGFLKNVSFFKGMNKYLIYDGRVHPNYSVGKGQNPWNKYEESGTVTGRFTCDNPNLQQLPRDNDVRGMLCKSPGFDYWIGLDYSQNELRCAAYITQEPVMLEVFRNGLDIHTQVMSDMLSRPYEEIEIILANKKHSEYERMKQDRVVCKEINFGILFGLGARRLQGILWNKLKLEFSLDYCQGMIDNWLAKYSVVADWIKETQRYIAKNKFIRMPLGQMRRLPNAGWEKGEPRFQLRQGVNFPIQSMSAWILNIGLICLDQYFQSIESEAYILMNTHDSLDCEIKLASEDIETITNDIKHIMTYYVPDYMRSMFGVDFNVPLKVDLGYGERYSL